MFFFVDIDLDGIGKGLAAIVEGFCRENGYSYRVAKDTATVERCMVDYGNSGKPLKIEASYRRKEIPKEETKIRSHISCRYGTIHRHSIECGAGRYSGRFHRYAHYRTILQRPPAVSP